MRALFVGFLLLALISVSHGACWHSKLEPDETSCHDSVDKTEHAVESHWKNSKCESCWCKKGFMRCCDGWATRVSGGCSIKYDYETCTSELIVLDKSVPCAAVGK